MGKLRSAVLWDVAPCGRLRRLLVTANVAPDSPIVVTVIIEVLLFSDMSVLSRATQRNIPEDGILHCHSLENCKSYIA
jgi:hypothetical protein